MAKKRKLNSKNPIYNKVEKKTKYKKVFVKEVKGCKIYNLGMKYFKLREFACNCGCGKNKINRTFVRSINQLQENTVKMQMVVI